MVCTIQVKQRPSVRWPSQWGSPVPLCACVCVCVCVLCHRICVRGLELSGFNCQSVGLSLCRRVAVAVDVAGIYACSTCMLYKQFSCNCDTHTHTRRPASTLTHTYDGDSVCVLDDLHLTPNVSFVAICWLYIHISAPVYVCFTRLWLRFVVY